MIIVVPYGGNTIDTERGLAMTLEFLGNISEIHAKNSRDTTLWEAYENTGTVSISF